MPNFLMRMRDSSIERVERAKARVSESKIRNLAEGTACPTPLDLHAAGFDLIAEVKRRAPSGGDLALVDDVAARAETYARGGAAAISVLTEPSEFHGEVADITTASMAVPVPILRKDFLVDPYQLYEARVHGAAGALVIVRMLEESRLWDLLDAAAELDLFLLIEIFGHDDLAAGIRACTHARTRGVQTLLGVNTRDLVTLKVDPDRLASIAPSLPTDTPRVAESGIQTPEDIERAVELGYQVALVGTALMQSEDPAAFTAELIGAGRDVIRREDMNRTPRFGNVADRAKP